MKLHPILAVLFLAMLFLFSCTDAEIVSGSYHGKIYRTDTLDATVNVVELGDYYISIEVRYAPNAAFIEHAKLVKNNANAYNLVLSNSTGGYILTGYYYDGFLHIESWNNNYIFEGQQD